MNPNITVITVCLNDFVGLEHTLNSLAICKTLPYEVIVVDGLSDVSVSNCINKFSRFLKIRFISEKDRGLYDAMNKGLRICNTPLIHYLNSGDTVYGDPYSNIYLPGLLDVNINTVDGKLLKVDYIKLNGYAYCHQGIIFPSKHREYDINFRFTISFNK